MRYKLRKGQRIWDDIKKIKTLPQTGTTLRKHGGLMVRSTELVKLGKTAWLRTPGAKTTLWGLGTGAALWGLGYLVDKKRKRKGIVPGGEKRFAKTQHSGRVLPTQLDKQLKVSYEGTPYNPNAETSKEKSSVLSYQMDQDRPKKKKDTKVQPIIKDRYVLYGGVKVYPKGRQFRGYGPYKN
jgi:hypothetical protein